MSKKLEILKNSLAKSKELQRRFDVHFATVKQKQMGNR